MKDIFTMPPLAAVLLLMLRSILSRPNVCVSLNTRNSQTATQKIYELHTATEERCPSCLCKYSLLLLFHSSFPWLQI